MAKVAFTELTIRNLKPGAYFDEKTPAFGISCPSTVAQSPAPKTFA